MMSFGLWALAVFLLLLAVRILYKRRWFFAWLAGTVAIASVVLAIVLAALGFDLRAYDALVPGQKIAKITFFELKKQTFVAELSYVDGLNSAQSFEIYGDQWQLDARILAWAPAVSKLGLTPIYRLSRLSGRYLTLEQARSSQRSVFDVGPANKGIDVWPYLHRWRESLPYMLPQYGSATFMPMGNQASFDIVLTDNGLAAQPSNEIARLLVEGWL